MLTEKNDARLKLAGIVARRNEVSKLAALMWIRDNQQRLIEMKRRVLLGEKLEFPTMDRPTRQRYEKKARERYEEWKKEQQALQKESTEE